MVMDLTTEDVKRQYDRYPYPSFSWLAKATPVMSCHASFEAGFSITQKRLLKHDDKSIALLGCGTFEPYVMGQLHQRAQITAVDLSSTSLRLAKIRCSLRKVRNVSFEESDILEFCRSHPEEFDFIHCYGALHHLEDPSQGFKALSESLK